MLYRNDGKGNFEDARVPTGIAALTAAVTGFGTDWFDYDNDGWLDLFVANGAVNVIESQRGQPNPVPHEEPALSQLWHRTLRRRERRRRSCVRARRDQPGRRLRRHRQRWRHRHRGHDERRSGSPAAESGNVREITGSTSRCRTRPATALALALELESNAPASPRCGAACTRTEATCRRATSASHVGLGSSTGIGSVIVQWVDGTRERWTNVAADNSLRSDGERDKSQ